MEFETETIAAAERVMGVRYTEAERRLMQDNLAPQIESARKRRELDFPNDLAPATRFDPRLPGFRAPPPPRPPRWSAPEPGPLPPQDEDIAFAPLTHLAHWIRAGALTSRRLTEIYLSRIETIAPRLECFVTVTAERARAEADAMDARSRAGTPLGPLHGIPYALKDLFDAAGVRTTWGAEPWADRVAERDAVVVERLRAAGPMLIASNFTGHPCLHLPAGFHRVSTRSELSLAEGRLDLGDATESEETFEVPHGVSLWAGLFEESRLLSVGRRLEEALGVAARRPTLAR